jgi:hypothetical protein
MLLARMRPSLISFAVLLKPRYDGLPTSATLRFARRPLGTQVRPPSADVRHADVHVSLCQVERAPFLARSRERAMRSFYNSQFAMSASRQRFLRSQNRTSIPCLKPLRAVTED